MKKRIIILLIGMLFMAACANKATETKLSEYRADANHYCQAHSAEYWEEKGMLDALANMEPTEKQNILGNEFRSTVKTPEMFEIIYTQGQHMRGKEFYPFLQKKVPELTKEPFDCPAIPEFYVSQP